MGFLDWMRRGRRAKEPEPESEPSGPVGYDGKGNPIDLVHSGDWQSETGIRETRVHLGKSTEGFHGGFQDVPTGGDGPIRWSSPQNDVEGGWLAAYRMYDQWKNDNSQAFLNFENNAIREFERKNGSRTETDSKQPEGLNEPKPSRTYSIFGDYPDRVLKTEADVKKDDALLDMTLVVNEIANDPDTNWRKYKGEFEKAVKDMREAFEPERRVRQEEKPALHEPDSARVHFWRSSWEPKGYVGAIDVEPGNAQEGLDRAFSAFNGKDDRVVFQGPSASVGDTFIHESTLGRGTQLSVYRIERSGYERLPASEFGGELKGWLDKSFGAAAKQLEPGVTPIWMSGKIERSGYDRDLGAHFTESVRGELGESPEGFHYRIKPVDAQPDPYAIYNFWSGPQATREAAAASMKKDLVAEERNFSRLYAADQGGAFARVGDAMRNGYAVDGAGQVNAHTPRGEREHPGTKVTELQDYNRKQSPDAGPENASRPVDRSGSWDR